MKYFELFSEIQFPYSQSGDIEKMINRFISISYVADFVSKSKENLEFVSKKIKEVYLNNPKLKNLKLYSIPHLQHISIYQSKIL